MEYIIIMITLKMTGLFDKIHTLSDEEGIDINESD